MGGWAMRLSRAWAWWQRREFSPHQASRLVRPPNESNLVRYEKAHRAAGMRIESISLSAVPALIADGRIRVACTVAAFAPAVSHARPG